MDQDLELLHKKVDFLTEQVMLNQRRHQEWVELKQDMTPIVNDLFKTAVTELDQLTPYFSSDDLVYLLKKLLRNTRQFITLLEQLESASDFIQDATPLSKDVFKVALQNLDQLEKKGYFSFLREAVNVVDQVVDSFSAEDVRQLGDNIVTILNTVKQLTQPELMRTVQNVLAVYQNLNINPPEKTSFWALLKQLGDPEVRQGLATGLEILRNVSGNLAQNQPNADYPSGQSG